MKGDQCVWNSSGVEGFDCGYGEHFINFRDSEVKALKGVE